MTTLEDFRARVEAFLARTAMSDSRFGRLACNDPAFVGELRTGREPRLSTIATVERFMATWQPPAEPRDGGGPEFQAAR